MQPGLHALECTRCGAPLDPKDADVGSVVRCVHCNQPHLWVAPDRVEAQPAPAGRAPATDGDRSSTSGYLVLAGLALVFVVLVGAVAAVLFLRSGSRATSDEIALTADVPLVRGDQLRMVLTQDGRHESCDVNVLGFADDGRPIGVACRASAPAALSRELLRLQSCQFVEPEAPDIVMFKGPDGWTRAAIEAPELGGKYRVVELGAPGKVHVVARTELALVQSSKRTEPVRAQLPRGAPVEVGDLLWQTSQGILHQVRLGEVADSEVKLAVLPARPGAPDVAAARDDLMISIVRTPDPVNVGSIVLAQRDGRWQRREVVRVETASHTLRVRAPGSTEEESLTQQDLLLARPPAPTNAEPGVVQSRAVNLPPKAKLELKRSLRNCFQAALRETPHAQGNLNLTLVVLADGAIESVESSATGTLPPSMSKCAVAALKGTKIEPSPGTKSVYTVPVTFVRQD